MVQVSIATPSETTRRLADALRVLDDPSGSPDASDDRRAHERVSFPFRICVTWTDEIRCAHACQARGCNICYGGISIVLPQSLERGQVVSMMLPQPGAEHLLMRAKVVYCRPIGENFEAGLQFIREPNT
ncbi:MAG: hypothetical protein GC159_09310 [Phycisphaera sp.]|nr:hypothetical protein [Phycisphaera sp.]